MSKNEVTPDMEFRKGVTGVNSSVSDHSNRNGITKVNKEAKQDNTSKIDGQYSEVSSGKTPSYPKQGVMNMMSHDE